MSTSYIILLLSLLLGLQPIATDLYLPALPALTEGFGASIVQAQLTLTALLLAFGTSQLVWGPVSDKYGRRPVLLAGLSLFALSGIACAQANTMETLIFWRAIQGVAMGAGVMAARAIVRDLYPPEIGAAVLSKGLSGLGIIACLSAPIGGFLSDLLSWRYALFALVVSGVVTLAVVAWGFQETVPQKNPRALAPSKLLQTWTHIVRHPTFVAFTILSMTSYCGLFTFLASSSFVMIKVLHLSKTQYGLLMMSMSLAYIAGTLLCRRLLPRYGIKRTLAIAGGFSFCSSTAIGLLALWGSNQPWYGVWAIMLPYYLFMLGHGIHQPCGQSGAVGPFPHAAGAASALNGFIMMLGAFALGHWLGWRLDGTVFALTQGVWFFGTLIALTAWTLVQRLDLTST